MMQIANILPGQWQRYARFNYSIWVHRFARALDAEIKQLPEKPPPLPWPVYEKPVGQLRAVNDVLYPKSGPQFEGKPKPSARQYLSSYVPRFVNESRARTEVYRGEDGDNFQLRIKKCWDYPRAWSIEGVVDPGSTVHLPFFREVTIRLPLKAKVCRELEATKDGRWVGKCRSVKRLNAREPLIEVTKLLLEKGQNISARCAEFSAEQPPRAEAPWQLSSAPIFRGAARGPADGQQLSANGFATGSSPAAHGSLLMPQRHPHPASPTGRGVSPGLAAFRAKQGERDRWAARPRLERTLPLEGAIHAEGFFPAQGLRRWTPPRELERRAQEYEISRDAEMEVIRVMMQRTGLAYGFMDGYVPDYLKQDDLDGYLVTKKKVGPDPHHRLLPEPCYRTAKWWRGYGRWGGKKKRYLTARERLARVKPSLKIVPTGPRSAELIITRRMHELSPGLAEALHLARMIEGAIKYRNPPRPDRKQSWRQELRSQLINDAGRFVWLIRNPIDTLASGKWIRDVMDSGEGIRDNGRTRTWQLGPVDPQVLKAYQKGFLPKLTRLFPETRLSKQYLDLVDRGWLTRELTNDPIARQTDGRTNGATNGLPLFDATPTADFATKIEGFPLRLPVAVMPPAAYQRWLAKSRTKPRRRKRRTRNRAGCSCSFRPPVFRAQPGPAKSEDAFFLRN